MGAYIPTIDPASITMQEKLAAARRELALRKNVYPKWVERLQARQGGA